MDPIVNSIATANAVIDELFAAEAEILGDWKDSRSSIRIGGRGSSTALPQTY